MRCGTIACLLALVLMIAVPGLPAQDRPTARPAPARLAEPLRVRERLGLAAQFEGVAGVSSLTIAVLDYGFDGLAAGRHYLPEGAEVVENYDPDFVRRFGLGDPEYRKPFEPGNRHGREMAQIVWAVAGARPEGPKFLLLNANGPTMLRRAVRYAIERKADIILFSGSFEGGGNGDGQGPVARIVSEAVDRGILWINAAGNYGGRVYNGPVRVLADGYLRLRDGSDVASLRFRNRVDENTVTITLTWNDYRAEEDAGTDKDLDLYVEDWAGRLVAAGDKVQVPAARQPGPTESRNPRERVVLADLAANPHVAADPDYCYRIRVRARRGRFTPADRLRILITAARDVYVPTGATLPEDAVTFVDATVGGEIYPPADLPGVITVGDLGTSSSIGPTLDGRSKPEVVLEDSRSYFTDGQVSVGSSNAAAYFAGIAAVLKAVEPGLRPSDLVRLARQGKPLPLPINGNDRVARPPGPTRPPAGLGLHLWQTPTRARLAEAVRGGR